MARYKNGAEGFTGLFFDAGIEGERPSRSWLAEVEGMPQPHVLFRAVLL